MDNNIIWQPCSIYQPGYSFGILLDKEFAKEMFNSKLSPENYQRMQCLPKELMGFTNPEPYRFHGDTCFVRQINLHVGDGKFLSLENACGGAKPNFDYRTSSSDVLTLMGLFDLWVEFSECIRDK